MNQPQSTLNPFTCPICNKQFKSTIYLNKHKKLTHTTIPVEHQQCPKCPRKFKSLKSFWAHVMSVHERIETGPDDVVGEEPLGGADGSSNLDLSELKRLERTTTVKKLGVVGNARPVNCAVCHKSFDSIDKFTQHLNTVHLAPDLRTDLKCGRCGVLFVSEGMLQDHVQTIHKKRLANHLSFTCTHCPVSFSSVSSLWRHKLTVHNLDFGITTPDLLQSPGTELQLKSRPTTTCQKITRSYYYDCQECGKKFKDSKSLRAHEVSHVNVANEKYLKAMLKSVFGVVCKNTLTCGLCSCEVSSSLEGRIHVYVKHYSTFVKYFSNRDVGLPCPECNRYFGSKAQVVEHLRELHVAYSIPTCEVCGYKDLTERGVNFHYKQCHPGTSRYGCNVCGCNFSTGKDLKAHVKVEHGEDEPGECPYCDQRHVRVRMHVSKKHPEKVGEYSEVVKNAVKLEVEGRKLFNRFLGRDDGGGQRDEDGREIGGLGYTIKREVDHQLVVVRHDDGDEEGMSVADDDEFNRGGDQQQIDNDLVVKVEERLSDFEMRELGMGMDEDGADLCFE